MKTLVIAPHCDDAEFGCGGYIARLGRKAMIAVLSASDYESRSGVITRETRLLEQRAAAAILNCQVQEPCKPEDGGMAENYFHCDKIGLIRLVERLIDAYRPEELLFPLPSFNQDHTATYEAVITATRPVALRPDRMLAYEYPMNCWGPQPPNAGKVYFPLGPDELHKKKLALAQHPSQVEGKGHTVAGVGGVGALARMRGLECGYPYAELFYLHTEVLHVDEGAY